MKILSYIGGAALLLSGLPAFADDNIAACEVVIQQPILSDEEVAEAKSADDDAKVTMIATFVPAEDFVFSVFDDEPGHLREVEGKPILAVMCQRKYLVPTEFDLRMIETGIPLYLSQNFDSTESDLMTVFLKDDQFQYQYSGADLSKDSQEILDIRLATLNEGFADKEAEEDQEE